MNTDITWAEARFASGDRVRLSTLGLARLPRTPQPHRGVIVSQIGQASYRVLFDQRRFPVSLHESYIEHDG